MDAAVGPCCFPQKQSPEGDAAMQKAWAFTLEITGYGETAEAAWQDAVETVLNDLGYYFDPESLPDHQRTPHRDLEESPRLHGPGTTAEGLAKEMQRFPNQLHVVGDAEG
jgi:hypothetical protein